ncbi:MAG: hypothetical protein IPI01_16630 [Ignavibacteriae bacterium]|nr:hypothetical protein [Ignavibacteriota bacterium]
MRTAAIVAFVAIFVTCTARGAVPAGDHPDLRRDGNIVTTAIATENGTRMLGVNAGFLDGANETKLFGRNRPTTLWSDKRRTECYEFSLRIACQMPLLTGVMTDVDAQEILQEMGFIAGEGSAVAGALDALKYNYVSSSTWAGRASNEISTWMRKINPRTVRGLKITPRNLVHISEALATVEGVAMAADFALGAAIQEALAGDLALARLDLIEQIIDRRRRAGAEVDPAIRPALARVRENLDRSKDYFGALITELNDRKGDVTKIGISAILEVTKADAVRLLTKYYVHHAVKAAATKAATVAGLWTWSLMLTYETIATILEQHQQAQIAVTSTSLALLLEEEITKGRLAEDETVCGLQRQLEYSYYDQMVDACSGIAQLWYDLVTSGFSRGPYAEARDEFTRLRGLTRDALLACTPPGSGSSDANPQTDP